MWAVEIDFLLFCWPDITRFRMSMKIDWVIVWVVEIDLLSVWVVEIDLVYVHGAKITCF